MTTIVETSTPPGTPKPIGPYNHIAKVGPFIIIGGTAGFDPASGELARPDVYAQAKQMVGYPEGAHSVIDHERCPRESGAGQPHVLPESDGPDPALWRGQESGESCSPTQGPASRLPPSRHAVRNRGQELAESIVVT